MFASLVLWGVFVMCF